MTHTEYFLIMFVLATIAGNTSKNESSAAIWYLSSMIHLVIAIVFMFKGA